MKLTELEPGFLGTGGSGVYDKDHNPIPRREGIGIHFNCPCGCGDEIIVEFRNPLDGGPPTRKLQHSWQRTGTTFEDLTLHPSIRKLDCGWHGWVKNGEVTGKVEK